MEKIIHIPGFNLRVTRKLIVDLSMHFFLTLFLSVFMFCYTRNILLTFLVFTGGVLIDTDHFIDYFLHLDKWDIHSFLHGHFVASRKLYLIFHGWEIVLIFAVLSLKWFLFFPLALGMAGHLTIDTLMHARRSPFSYFILFRWYHRFSFDKINYYSFEKQMKNLKKAGLLDKDQKTEENE